MAGIRTVDVGDYVKDGADLVEHRGPVVGAGRLPPARALRRAGVKTGQAVEVRLDALPGRASPAASTRWTRSDRCQRPLAAGAGPARQPRRRAQVGHVRAHAHRVRGARERADRARGGAGAAGRQAVPVQGGRRADGQGGAAHRGAHRPAPAGQGRDARRPGRRRPAWSPPARRGCCAATRCRCAWSTWPRPRRGRPDAGWRRAAGQRGVGAAAAPAP